jgi:hypothetical protein
VGVANWDSWGIAWSSGNVYLAETDATIRKLSLATGQVTIIAGASQQHGSADGPGDQARFGILHQMVAMGGVLYIVDDNTIRTLALDTNQVSTIAGTPGLPGYADGIGADALFDGAWFIGNDPSGILYIGEQANHIVRRLDLATNRVTTLAGVPGKKGVRPGPLPGSLSYPGGVAVVAGGLAVSDENSLLLIH